VNKAELEGIVAESRLKHFYLRPKEFSIITAEDNSAKQTSISNTQGTSNFKDGEERELPTVRGRGRPSRQRGLQVRI
jgi:hypothetical protein